jgi:putative ATP-binding cassette transporter
VAFRAYEVLELRIVATAQSSAHSCRYARLAAIEAPTAAPGEFLSIAHGVVTDPAGVVLLEDVDLTVRPRGCHIVIQLPAPADEVGARSGQAVGALLRAMAGLLPLAHGRVTAPMGGVAYLGPQPYICGHCSLRQLLIYPQLESEFLRGPREGQSAVDADAALLVEVRRATLSHVVEEAEGLDAVRDWPAVLSAGEKQRVAFVRLLVRREAGDLPTVLLDNATHALSCDIEVALLQHLRDRQYAMVSVSTRAPALQGDVVYEVAGTRLAPAQ